MDALIVAGVSKFQGSQFSVKKSIHLIKDDEITLDHLNSNIKDGNELLSKKRIELDNIKEMKSKYADKS